jgi:membrane-bound inhibitor of C-type lysozyme
MPRPLLLIFLAMPLLGACTLHSGGPVAHDYSCADGRMPRVTYLSGPDVMVLLLDGEETRLQHRLSADGARYGTGTTEFWARGRNATLSTAGATTTCTQN